MGSTNPGQLLYYSSGNPSHLSHLFLGYPYPTHQLIFDFLEPQNDNSYIIKISFHNTARIEDVLSLKPFYFLPV